ncbi:MAG: hypothetical protein J1F10_03930 [Muribaculaceae bacterium]|nr:hypothetical protein [Muribaculaceae bacterium]
MCRIVVYLLFLFIYISASAETLKLIWKNTDVASQRQWGEENYPSWQGFGMNGKYYIQNATKEVIEIWNETGKISEISSGKGTNISHDDFGNIIVRYSSYLKPILIQGQVLVVNPKTGQRKIIDEAIISGDKCYLFGRAYGNIYSDYGALYCLAQGDTEINKISISYGNYLWESVNYFDLRHIIYPDIDINKNRGLNPINNNAMVIPHNSDDGFTLSISNPYIDLTGYSAGNANSIYIVKINGNTLDKIGFYRTPFHNGCAGFDILRMNDNTGYIVYPSGMNNIDGFSVAKITDYSETPQNEESDNNLLLVTKEEDCINGESIYKNVNNEIHVNNLNFEFLEDGRIYIYQYVPCAYVAMYELISDNNMVDEKLNNDVEFKIIENTLQFPEPTYHRIYNLSGTCIANKISASEILSKGVYILRTNHSIQKIVIH